MIRGNYLPICQLRSWVLMGQLSTTKEWVEIDRHTNEPQFNMDEVRTFNVHRNERFVSVQLIQTGPNNGYFGRLYHCLAISGFDIYGEVFE